jgi:hypothetical protein
MLLTNISAPLTISSSHGNSFLRAKVDISFADPDSSDTGVSAVVELTAA